AKIEVAAVQLVQQEEHTERYQNRRTRQAADCAALAMTPDLVAHCPYSSPFLVLTAAHSCAFAATGNRSQSVPPAKISRQSGSAQRIQNCAAGSGDRRQSESLDPWVGARSTPRLDPLGPRPSGGPSRYAKHQWPCRR